MNLPQPFAAGADIGQNILSGWYFAVPDERPATSLYVGVKGAWPNDQSPAGNFTPLAPIMFVAYAPYHTSISSTFSTVASRCLLPHTVHD